MAFIAGNQLTTDGTCVIRRTRDTASQVATRRMIQVSEPLPGIFCLNVPPMRTDVQYVWIDTEVWNDLYTWMG